MTLDIVANDTVTTPRVFTAIPQKLTVIKTLGNQEEFSQEKLLKAIKKATGYSDNGVRIAEEVCDYVMKKVTAPTVTTGYINALVEGYLLAKYEKVKDIKYKTVLDKYIKNKRRKQDELMQKVSHMKDVILGATSIGELRKFSFNQTQIAAARYLLRNVETGEVIETIPEWFHRVASHVVLGSIMYDEEIYSKENITSKRKKKTAYGKIGHPISRYKLDIILNKYQELSEHMKYSFLKTLKIITTKLFKKYEYLYRDYYNFMYQGIFEPNTPTLLNAGTPSGACSACFTVAVYDNMGSIMNTGTTAAFIFKAAGGFGTNISYIRPAGSPVGNTYNAATGPINLVLEQINFLTDLVKAGGKRRGANMGIMEYWHPQILEFIDYKLKPGKLENFNISVMFDEEFWNIYDDGEFIELKFGDKSYNSISAHGLIKHIADNAWKSAEPGVLFADNANKKNPLRELWGDIKITNPCCSGNTRLHTNKGMRKVRDLYVRDEEIEVAVDTVMHKSFKRYSKQNETLMMQMKASKVFKTSDNETLLRIETEDGYELECTPYHPMILANGDEKKASDLTTDDELLLQSSKGIFGEEGTSDIGALLGFAQNHMQLIEDSDKFLDVVFQKYTNLNKFDNIYHVLKKQYIPSFAGEPLPLNFALQVCNFEKDRVPDIIWEGTEMTVKAYLKLLFSTSALCVVERELIRYYNRSKRFLQDLQILLINFGIKSTIRGDDNAYYITVSGKSFKPYMYKVGLTTSSKIKNIDVPRNSTGEVKYFTKVSKITELEGTHPVYDAEEYETHKLIFNGIITGNCSEQYMYHGESCTLGSINLSKFTDGKDFNFDGYKQAIRISTQFLNDVLEINQYPTEDIKDNSNITKRIGLGIMGLADLLFKMRIPYNSQEGYEIMKTLGYTLYIESVNKSISLAGVRGPCAAYKMLIRHGNKPSDAVDRIFGQYPVDWESLNEYGVRNMWTTTIAPTGTISMIADCSNGLEPIYALVYKKTVQTGDHYYLNKEFENALVEEGLYSDDLIKKVEQNYGSVQGLEEVPEWMQKVFVTAMDLHWTDHVVAQAVWQQYIDNSISKTINMPYNVTPEDIEYAYVLSHELGLKGVSVYRDGSRHLQVLHTDTSVKQKEGEIGAKSEKEITIIKKQLAPSSATIDYILKNVKNKDILDKFMKYIDNDKQQIYIQSNEKCPKEGCDGVLINQGGCNNCNICGFSVSCAVG